MTEIITVGWWPSVNIGADGSVSGFVPDWMKLLSDPIQYKPQFIFGARTWDESVAQVQNGTAQLGVTAIITEARTKIIDFPAFVHFTELIYIFPRPKPVDVFFQVLQPFDFIVWMTWIGVLAAFCTLFFVSYVAKVDNDQVPSFIGKSHTV